MAQIKTAGPMDDFIPARFRSTTPVARQMLHQPRRVVLDRPAVDDIKRLNGDIRKALEAALVALENGQAELDPKERELTGVYGLRLSAKWRAAVYFGADAQWHLFYVGPHTYDEVSKRWSRTGAAQHTAAAVVNGREMSATEIYSRTDRIRDRVASIDLRAAETLLRRVLGDRGFPQADQAWVARTPSANGAISTIGWDIELSPPVPGIYLHPRSMTDLVVLHEAAHLLELGGYQGARPVGRDRENAHNTRWFQIWRELVEQYGQPVTKGMFDKTFSLTRVDRIFEDAIPLVMRTAASVGRTAARYDHTMIGRGLKVSLDADEPDEKRVIEAALAGRATAAQIIGAAEKLLGGRVGEWWGVMGEFGDLEDFEDYAWSDQDLVTSVPDYDAGDLMVVLIGKRPTRNGQPWDPEEHNPSNGLMGNSYLHDREQVEIVEVRYNAGHGWRTAPGGTGLRATAAAGVILDVTGPDWVGDFDVRARLGEQVVGRLVGGKFNAAERIWVDPAHRRKGIATAMYEALLKHLPGTPRKPDEFSDSGAAWFSAVDGKQYGSTWGSDPDWAAWSRKEASAQHTALPSWRDRGTMPVADAVIAPDQGRGRRNSYMVYTYGQPFARRPTLREAKETLEEIYGPLAWTKKPGDTEPHHDPVWGQTTMFNDAPYYLVVERLPRLGVVASGALRYEHLKDRMPEGLGSYADTRPVFGPNWSDVLVAYDGAKAVAHLAWLTNTDSMTSGSIDAVYVDPAYRRQGIATELLRRARRVFPGIDVNSSAWFTDDGEAWRRAVGSKSASAKTAGFNFGMYPEGFREANAYKWGVKARGPYAEEYPGSFIYAIPGAALWYEKRGDKIAIHSLHVESFMRRQGVATKILDGLAKEYPGAIVYPGGLTPEGRPLWTGWVAKHNWQILDQTHFVVRLKAATSSTRTAAAGFSGQGIYEMDIADASRGDRCVALLIESMGTLVPVAWLTWNTAQRIVEGVWVSEPNRRKGIGAALLAAAEKVAGATMRDSGEYTDAGLAWATGVGMAPTRRSTTSESEMARMHGRMMELLLGGYDRIVAKVG